MSKLIIFLFLLAALTSCTTSRSVAKNNITVDSLVYQQNENLQRTLQETIANYEKQLRDSNAVVIEFDTLRTTDTVTRVIFKDGKVERIQGPVKYIRITDTHAEDVRDSLYTTTLIMQDSINTLKAEKHVEIKTVEKVVKRFPLWWLLVAAVIGWIGRGYWPALRFKLFGK